MDEQINAPTEDQILSLLAQKRFEDEQKLNRTVDSDIASNLIKYREAIAGQSPQMQYFPSMSGGTRAMVDPTIDEKMAAMQRQRDVLNEIERLKKQRASLPSGDVVGSYLTMADMPSAAQAQQAPQAVIAAASEAPRPMQAVSVAQAQPQPVQQNRRNQFLQSAFKSIDSLPASMRARAVGDVLKIADTFYAPEISTVAREITTPEGARTGYAMIGGKAVEMKQPETKALTADQGNTMQFASRMASAENDLSNAVKSYDPSGRLSGLGFVPDRLKSDDRRTYESARDFFISAALRKESGAAIGKDEYVNAYKQYMPAPGDSVEELQRKSQRRQLMIKTMAATLPAQYQAAQQQQAVPAQQSGSPVMRFNSKGQRIQ